MKNTQQERLDYQKLYGIQKDYISLSKEEKKQKVGDEVIDFDNKNLISYLDDKYQVEETEKVKEDKAKAIVKACFMIQSGFNICFHGYGSKKRIMQEISEFYNNMPKLIIQGYSPATSVQQIVKKLKYIVTKLTGENFGQKRTEGILEYLKQSEENMEKISSQFPFILIIFHNIDSKQFIDQESVRILSTILNLPYVKAICSIDHVKYSIVLTSKIIEGFNFNFIEVNTHDCYLPEFKVLQNTFNQKKEKEGESLKYIFRSLTKVQRDIIQFLAKYIKDNLDQNPGQSIQINGQTEDGQIIGLTLKQLVELLIDEMILSSEQQLKENLLEILDHKVFISVDSQQKTYYTMNYSKPVLDKIINNKLEEEEEQLQQEEENDSVKDMEEEKQKLTSEQSCSESEQEEEKIKNKKKTRKGGKKQKSSSSESESSYSEDEKPQKNKKATGHSKIGNKKQNKKKQGYVSEDNDEDQED